MGKKRQENRNDANSTSSSGSVGGASIMTATHPVPGMPGAGVTVPSPEAGAGEEEAAAQRGTRTM